MTLSAESDEQDSEESESRSSVSGLKMSNVSSFGELFLTWWMVKYF